MLLRIRGRLWHTVDNGRGHVAHIPLHKPHRHARKRRLSQEISCFLYKKNRQRAHIYLHIHGPSEYTQPSSPHDFPSNTHQNKSDKLFDMPALDSLNLQLPYSLSITPLFLSLALYYASTKPIATDTKNRPVCA